MNGMLVAAGQFSKSAKGLANLRICCLPPFFFCHTLYLDKRKKSCKRKGAG
jgi:hypothetical protein